MPYGTLNTLDTLASLRAATNVVAEIGEDVAFESINAALQTHSMLLKEAVSDFVEMTTDRLRRYGGPDSMALEELDEYGTAGAQKVAPGATFCAPAVPYSSNSSSAMLSGPPYLRKRSVVISTKSETASFKSIE